MLDRRLPYTNLYRLVSRTLCRPVKPLSCFCNCLAIWRGIAGGVSPLVIWPVWSAVILEIERRWILLSRIEPKFTALALIRILPALVDGDLSTSSEAN